MDLPEQPGFEMPVDVAVTNKDKENDGDRIAPALALNVDRRSCFLTENFPGAMITGMAKKVEQLRMGAQSKKGLSPGKVSGLADSASPTKSDF